MSFSSTTKTNQLHQYQQVRQFTIQLVAPLEPEDMVIQSMPDASPSKWHLAHTTWFFEQFVLLNKLPGYKVFHPQFSFLFNSYYNTVGKRQPRAHRGILSRPAIAEVIEYRDYVDTHIAQFFDQHEFETPDPILEIGIHHEQQHQELLLTDIKHALSCNPLRPAYRVNLNEVNGTSVMPFDWAEFNGGIVEVGHRGQGFHYDNEAPRHAALLRDYQLANRLTTNGEYLEFIEAGGYQNPALWLAEGWDDVCREQWIAPLYWELLDCHWQQFTLGGLRPLDLHEPVTHVSFFEADAYARWRGCRLPTEFEWENGAERSITNNDERFISGNFVEQDFLHPIPESLSKDSAEVTQMFGDVWEWTASPYVAYPGYVPPSGAIGEYNGKFMSSQWVLRGGSCASSHTHLRSTYRNFFHPDKRWQFSGIRLAK